MLTLQWNGNLLPFSVKIFSYILEVFIGSLVYLHIGTECSVSRLSLV